jgi:hypothetical protein
VRLTQVEQKDGHAIVRATGLVSRRGAGEQQHQVRMLNARGPNLLAVDHPLIAVAHGGAADAAGIRTGRRLGHAERLQAQRSGRDLWQVARLLLRRAMPQDGAHRVDLSVAGGAVAAGLLNLFENGSGGGKAETAAAILRRDQSGEKARFGQRADKRVRIGALVIERPPIVSRKVCTQRTHRRADVFEGFHH